MILRFIDSFHSWLNVCRPSISFIVISAEAMSWDNIPAFDLIFTQYYDLKQHWMPIIWLQIVWFMLLQLVLLILSVLYYRWPYWNSLEERYHHAVCLRCRDSFYYHWLFYHEVSVHRIQPIFNPNWMCFPRFFLSSCR